MFHLFYHALYKKQAPQHTTYYIHKKRQRSQGSSTSEHMRPRTCQHESCKITTGITGNNILLFRSLFFRGTNTRTRKLLWPEEQHRIADTVLRHARRLGDSAHRKHLLRRKHSQRTLEARRRVRQYYTGLTLETYEIRDQHKGTVIHRTCNTNN